MRKLTDRLIPALGAALTGVALAGSLATPARAQLIKPTVPVLVDTRPPVEPKPEVPINTNIPVNPKPPITVDTPQRLLADLRLEKLEITASRIENFAWPLMKVRATLRNYVRAYPGGGTLVIHATTGGMTPTRPPFELFAAAPYPGTTFTKPIPALGVGQAITLETDWSKPRIFRAFVQVDPQDTGGQDPQLPEGPTSNNSKELNVLKPGVIDLSQRLNTNLLMSGVQIRLDSTDAFLKAPGVVGGEWSDTGSVDSHWKVPAITNGGGIIRWAVKDVNFQGGADQDGRPNGVQSGALILHLQFETDGTELDGYLSEGPNLPTPDFEASPIEATVRLPLSYDASFQFLRCADQPQMTVHAPLAGATPFMQMEFNNRIANAVRDLFTNGNFQQLLEYRLNTHIRQMDQGPGRIVGADFVDGTVKLRVESAVW